MPAPATVASPVVTCLRYRNASAAIEWLVHAFGFEAQRIVPGPADTIVHAQLTLGSGMIMLASVTDTPFSRYMKQPDEVGGVETQSVYLVVADPDQAYRDAQAAGAEILIDIADADYGGRGFSCRDPEGHIWSVGSYDPWQ
ncbi:PhnB protein [Bordetella pertussis]|uniref:VOC domain-containing protein n=10 Tax=Bordetella TaxID=517 RepID=Q7W0F1_BORPE|nr:MULTISPECIES: VOC family protein [Bordetella]ETH37958.1 glyoxalase-like domain protein [Bordetella pertussis H918]ETH41687.1 glyoxalase-like domain protein [Bordetella pertussis H939]ETH45879.1 glyoxalase-like domain protein [Bordetella pertussis H921]ETH73258.1 glyoxalase-like domain protein [Bordetella pertussis STO1-CHLA-0011]ETH83012.1 glyoxalase-like domain protein [Bordetella pertussis STO1-CHOC-0017]ETH88741.1 glyoxalase-like domain protein [Bordetella pertussis STO1-CHOC-0018]ETH9